MHSRSPSFAGIATPTTMLLMVLVLTLLFLASCSPPDNSASSKTAASRVTLTETGETTTTTRVPVAIDVVPGTATVQWGEERFNFKVFECLIGEETGSPTRRLALSASNTEPFFDADVHLNVDILVSTRTKSEDHLITITRMADPTLGAADASLPSRGGPAPEDWIRVDEAKRVVTGSGFRLRATDGSSTPNVEGTLVADCPKRRS